MASNELQKRKETIGVTSGVSISEVDGFVCPLCKNDGYILSISADGRPQAKECSCVWERKIACNLKKSGANTNYTFDRFIASEEWQTYIYDKAKLNSQDKSSWFYIGGQPGCGKTHLCTAILIYSAGLGIKPLYLDWRNQVNKLTSFSNPDRDSSIEKYEKCDLLYIDDLFKTRKDAEIPSSEQNLAFEIINYRYNNNLKTIISSEKSINDLLYMDEALGGRIQEKCGACLNISPDKLKDFRLQKTP